MAGGAGGLMESPLAEASVAAGAVASSTCAGVAPAKLTWSVDGSVAVKSSVSGWCRSASPTLSGRSFTSHPMGSLIPGRGRGDRAMW